MAMTKTSMANFVETHMAAVTPNQIDGAGDHSLTRKQYLEALCQGIIDEIRANGEVSTSGGHTAMGPGLHVHPPGNIK